MTSSAVRSSAGSRSKGGEEAIDISWDLKVMGYLCVSPYDIFRINENLGRRHRGKTVRLRGDMSRVVAWSRVGSPTTCQACRAALGSPLLLNQRHLRIYKNIKMLHYILQIYLFQDISGWGFLLLLLLFNFFKHLSFTWVVNGELLANVGLGDGGGGGGVGVARVVLLLHALLLLLPHLVVLLLLLLWLFLSDGLVNSLFRWLLLLATLLKV